MPIKMSLDNSILIQLSCSKQGRIQTLVLAVNFSRKDEIYDEETG